MISANPQGHFPKTVDSTMIGTFRSCPHKFFRSYVQHWKPLGESIHLVAGGAFAKGLEVARKSFYVAGLNETDSIAAGINALVQDYGEFEANDHAKSCERMCGALEFYFSNYPLAGDPTPPVIMADGNPAIEFTFALPFGDLRHPETGDPLLYAGRLDMIATFAGRPWTFDDKTATSLGQSWTKQWELRCFASGHELYTRNGWKSIEMLKLGEEVIQSTEIGELSFGKILDKIDKEVDTEMVELEGRRLSQLITSNHRILLNKRRGGEIVCLAESLHKQDQRNAIPLSGILKTEHRLAPAVQRLIAAIQADGTLRHSGGKVSSGRGHREHMKVPAIDFSFTKPRKIQRMKALLEELAIPYTTHSNGTTFRISGHEESAETLLKFLTPDKKFIPGLETLFDHNFLDELEFWDGWKNQYYTQHKQNAEFVATVASLNNRGASCTLNSHGHYTVVLSNDVDRMLCSISQRTVPYKGLVHCVTVPSGYVLVRYKGNISISGNSQFTGYSWAAKQFGLDIAGAVIRGVSILKTKYETAQAITYRPDWEIERWFRTSYRDVQRMIKMWQALQLGDQESFPMNLDHSCADYGGCGFQKICKLENPDPWLPSYYTPKVWDPLAHREITLDEYHATFR